MHGLEGPLELLAPPSEERRVHGVEGAEGLELLSGGLEGVALGRVEEGQRLQDLRVLDVFGRTVRVLGGRQVYAGLVRWDGRNDLGRAVPSLISSACSKMPVSLSQASNSGAGRKPNTFRT